MRPLLSSLGLVVLSVGVAFAAPPYQGRPLAEVLAEFEAEGLPVLFNDRQVPPHLRVMEEPRATHPRARLEALLAPHGLVLEAGPGGRLLVTRPRGEALTAKVVLAGQVLDAVTGDPLSGVTVRLHPGSSERVLGPDGIFRFDEVPVRPTTLEVVSGSYLPYRRTLATVDLQQATDLVLKVEPLDSALGRMTVTASHYSLMYANPSASQYLSREEVDRVPHIADDVFRAMNYLPGVASGDFGARLNVRGGAADELLVTLDGMRLYDPYHLKDLLALFSIIDANTIDGVEFFSGAFPAEFGATNSGVMAVDSRSPQGEYRRRVGLSFVNAFVQASGDFDDGGHWLASARTGYLDVILKIIDEDDGLDPEYVDFFGKIERPVGDHSVLRFSTLLAGDRSFVVDEDFDPDDSDTDFIDTYAWLELESDLTPELRLSSRLFGGYLERDRRARIDEDLRLQAIAEDQRRFRFQGLSQEIEWLPPGGWSARAGYEVRWQDADYFYQGQAIINDLVFLTTRELPDIRIRNVDRSVDGASHALYGSVRKDWTPDLTTDFGLRWDRQTYTGLEDDDQFSPRLNALYRLGDRTQLRAAWGRFYQPQEINRLHVEDGQQDFQQAQLAEQSVLAVSHRTRNNIELRAELYDKRYQHVQPYFENLFHQNDILPEFQPDRVQVAPDSARARGIEVGARGGVPGGLQWWTSYVRSESEDRIDGRWVPRSWDQPDAVNIGLSFPMQSWDVTLAWRYHTGWPRTPVYDLVLEDGGVRLPVVGERNTDRYDPYHRLDLRASRDIPVPSGALTFYLEVINLYNRRNICCDQYVVFVNPNRVAYLNFPDQWLPFTPSLGLRWEF